MNGPRAQRLTPANLALAIGSIVVTLAVLELGLRVVDGGWQALTHWPNLVLQARTATWDKHTVHDDRLGFVPKPDFYWYRGMAHYDAHSDRLTPASSDSRVAGCSSRARRCRIRTCTARPCG